MKPSPPLWWTTQQGLEAGRPCPSPLQTNIPTLKITSSPMAVTAAGDDEELS